MAAKGHTGTWAWRGRVFGFGHPGERKEPPAFNTVSDCQCSGSYFQFTGHFAFGNWEHSAVVLVVVALPGAAGNGWHFGCSRATGRAHRFAQHGESLAGVST